MKPLGVVLGVLLMTPVFAGSAKAQTEPARPTLAVIPFDTQRTGWAPPPEFGLTMAERLGDRLIESGKFRVMDYSWLTDATDPQRRPPLDLLFRRAADAGVDYLVVGSLARYSTENRNRRFGLAGFVPFIGGGGRTTTETVMGLTIRVIDVRTGEIVTTTTAEGEASRKNVSLGGLGIGARSMALRAGGALLSSSNSGSREALLDEALQDAIELAGQALVNAAPRLTRRSDLDGM